MAHRSFRRLLPALGALLLAAAALGAGEGTEIFVVADPYGDDHGDGSLMYPTVEDFKPGTLDIVTFAARRVSAGTQFEVKFARPVVRPHRRAVDGGGTQLTTIARHDFYTFNVDIYADTDRVAGSGQVAMMPGRGAEISADRAWERAAVLTPRPDVARSQLTRILQWNSKKEYKAEHGRLDNETADRLDMEVIRDLEKSVYFPTLIEVTGSRVRFFVPDLFLGGPAQPTWSYAVVVTAADLMPAVNLGVSSGLIGDPMSRLMNLPVVPGKSYEQVGSSNKDIELLPAVIDLLEPAKGVQEKALAGYNVLEGRLAQVTGTVPADIAAAER